MDKKIISLFNLLNNLPISKWGIGDIKGFHPLSESFPKVISLAFAYTPDFETYNESKFNDLTAKNKATIKESVEALKKFFNEENIKFLIPEESVNENYVSSFSQKLAATRAGLGWVGKNSVLITEEYGSRVRLSSILIDLDIPSNEPVTESKCGHCRICVDACPHDCIHGENWRPGIERDLLFDAHKCKKIGHPIIPSLNRGFSCGICVFSCPIGKTLAK